MSTLPFIQAPYTWEGEKETLRNCQWDLVSERRKPASHPTQAQLPPNCHSQSTLSSSLLARAKVNFVSAAMKPHLSHTNSDSCNSLTYWREKAKKPNQRERERERERERRRKREKERTLWMIGQANGSKKWLNHWHHLDESGVCIWSNLFWADVTYSFARRERKRERERAVFHSVRTKLPWLQEEDWGFA